MGGGTPTSVIPYGVTFLKTIDFQKLPLNHQIGIKSVGRPKPEIQLFQVIIQSSSESKLEFKTSSYEENDWVCGCNVSNRLYCFPCLLFCKHYDHTWTKIGENDLTNLTTKMRKHELSATHINAQTELRLLGKQNIRQQLDATYRHNIQELNERVKKNRDVLSQIIDSIKFCGAFELALKGGGGESNDSVNSAIFRGPIDFSSELDIALKDYADYIKEFRDTKTMLLDFMLEIAQEAVIKQISAASFVSIIVKEITDFSSVYQLAVILRYILPTGIPVERFWTFINPFQPNAPSLTETIKNILKRVVDSPSKLLSQSYDGLSLMNSQFSEVQKAVAEEYTLCHPVYCYDHQSNSILMQATSHNLQIRIFFANLNEVTNFFSSSEEGTAVLDEVIGPRDPLASFTQWSTINTVYENREAILECLENLLENSHQTIIINKITTTYRTLADDMFIFWLTVFHRLLPHSEFLYRSIQETNVYTETLQEHIKQFETYIENEKNNMTDVKKLKDVITFNRKRKRGQEDEYIENIIAAKQVCDDIIEFAKDKFAFTDHINASNLFLIQHFLLYGKQFPCNYINATVKAYPFLNRHKLTSELKVIYSRDDFRVMSGAVNLLQFIIENKIEDIFSETVKLLKIIITIPTMTIEEGRCLSTLKSIQTFLLNSLNNQDKLIALAMLSIEKQLIKEIPNFNEMVIDKMAAKRGKTMDLCFKNFA